MNALDCVDRFAALVARIDVDVAEAALALAACADQTLEPAPWLRELDGMASGVTDLDGLRRRLFDELGFAGAEDDYYEPENSFLHRVIARRRGIPITLSVVTLAVGRRAGLTLDGIGMPGHFLVYAPAERVFLDPFAAGQLLDEAACEARFRAATGAGDEIAFGPHLLPVVGAHEILLRMLANLAAVYRAEDDALNLEWVLRLRLTLPAPSARDVSALAEALAARGALRDGAEVLEAHAHGTPDEDERAALLAAGRALRARLN
jgi:regulator of sirC expression with transglutaminase-like and TPR domain